MARLLGMLFVPGLAVIGGLMLLLGLVDRNERTLAVAGPVRLRSVAVVWTPRSRIL